MRIVSRLYGLGMIFVIIIVIYAQMFSFNVRQGELVNCTSSALTSTQIVMQEQIEDEIYGLNNMSGDKITSNEEYVDLFETYFEKLLVSDSDYTIEVYGVDYEKGLLDVGVKSTFKLLNGEDKTIEVRRTSIVEVKQ